MKKMVILSITVLLVLVVITFIINEEESKNKKTLGTGVETIDYYKNQITPEQLQQDISNNKAKIVYFYKTTCFYCAKVSPIIVPMAENMNISMQVLNLEDHSDGWDMFQIEGTPTIISYKEGKEANRILGEQSRETYQDWFEKNK
ncbi:thioredoxin family protein [Bacillus manliponensis]|uniref:thioredoxin family protein n=1 Tax=Bacillus manliponensis TaxID=574376 RepID=UPI003515C3BF